ncbi:hypothetical protein Tco_1248276, partial [Tanacetum coccineum]
MILVLKTSHHGPSEAMHNPSQLLRLLSKEVCFISHGDQHATIGFLIPRSLILKRVILFSIHSDDGNPSRVNIKQLCILNAINVYYLYDNREDKLAWSDRSENDKDFK